MSSQPPRFNRAWWHVWEYWIVAAVLLIVLALGIVLSSIPQQIHTSTLSRPTTPAEPTISGLHALECPAVPIVMMTASWEQPAWRAGGATAFLAKPFTIEQLLRYVRDYIRLLDP